MNSIPPALIGLAIPLLFILGGVVIAIVAIIMDSKKKELAHKERLTAMEKGISIPEEPIKEGRPPHLRNRSSGLVMFCLGIALTIAMWVAGGAIAGVWGLLPIAVGIGLLISSVLERRELDREKESPGYGQ